MGIKYSKARRSLFTGQEYRAFDEDTGAAVTLYVDPAEEIPHTDDDESVFRDGPQGQLFQHIPPKLETLIAHRDMQVPAMNLAMRAVMDHPGIRPSDNLSRHSAPLVRRAVQMGVMQPPKGIDNVDDIEATNNLTFDGWQPPQYKGLAMPFTDEEMGEANRTLREYLKKSRNRGKPRRRPMEHLGVQFQQQLPIFEQPTHP